MASDPAAVVEHTRKVLFLEDDDIAHIYDGELHIHRVRRNEDDKPIRSIETLELELKQIMKGKFDHFMQKEILNSQSLLSTQCVVVSTLKTILSNLEVYDLGSLLSEDADASL